MKYIYVLPLLFLIISCQTEEKKVIDREKTDWAFYKLDGDVKSVLTKSWQVNDKLEKIKYMHEDMSSRNTELFFDDSGMLQQEKSYLNDAPIEITTYNGKDKKQTIEQYVNNVVGVKITYDYDKPGNNTAITRRNADNSQIDRFEMKYQGKNLAQKMAYNAQNNPTEKINYTYDKRGNVIEENNYLGTEYIQYKAIYKYDSKNRILSEARYDKNSKLSYETVYKYDKDNLIKKYTRNGKNEIEYSEEFTYDKKGNVLTHLTFEKYDNSTTLDKYSYDDKGNRKTWEIIKNDTPYMTASFTFDKYGNPTSTIVTDPNGTEMDKRENQYEYDDKGNWIKKTISIKGTPQFVAERTITYFE